ncbi:hypothetical protein PR048_033657 [Dryococelus australis]|uniref:Down syndrome cell adhesion molecule-like protein Dscam2 n=1 Tax=Dryococelus australis TaxID=614101 RepID=A0ABQ9G1T0_9NEOP|nr:hypothetical protein PR048_033657 [Dryococelus australis]
MEKEREGEKEWRGEREREKEEEGGEGERGLPYIRLIPKVTAVAGETLHLKCPVAGYPIEDIRWERSGRELPDDLRQKVQSDGTMVISQVEKTKDAGVYTCTARNKQGHSARRSGEVAVIVPPKLSPFTSDRTQHVGERASLTCSVTKGDIPLTMTWLKDGRPLESSRRVSISQVDPFNSILLIESLSPDHNGNYSCVARNLAAEVSRTQQLTVNVPPIIEPFSFQDGLSEGMRTRTVCGVSQGDTPLAISWLKDGGALSPHLGVNVSALDPFSSLLSISSLASTHSGDYTCVASNAAAEVRYTAKLQVKGNSSLILASLFLSFSNYPYVSPFIYLSAYVPSMSLRFRCFGTGNASMTGNPKNVKEDREGFYLCQANNGIATGIGKVVELKVNSSPYFSAPSRIITVKKGDTATLKCDVSGDKPVNVMWLRGGKMELNPASNYRVSVKQDSTPHGVSAELQIEGAEASDSGAYFCQASNMYGRDQQLVQLLVQEPPKSPNNLEAVKIGSRSIKIQWQHQSVDSSEVAKFIVEYKENDGSWEHMELSSVPLPLSTVVEDLKPATRYVFRVVAEGPAGHSAPSAEFAVKTEPQRPAGPPLSVSARPVSSTELLVTWAPPLPELRHGDVQGYNVGYRESSSSATSFNFTSVAGDGEEGGGELLLGSLGKFTRYTVVLQAFNQVGSGPLSEPATAQTMEDTPRVTSIGHACGSPSVDAVGLLRPAKASTALPSLVCHLDHMTPATPSMPPQDVRCVALTSQSIQVSWQPPPTSHCNGILQGYKLHYEPLLQDLWPGTYQPNPTSHPFLTPSELRWCSVDEVETRKTTALTAVLTGLRKFANYSTQVLAFTRMGDGVATKALYCATEEDGTHCHALDITSPLWLRGCFGFSVEELNHMPFGSGSVSPFTLSAKVFPACEDPFCSVVMGRGPLVASPFSVWLLPGPPADIKVVVSSSQSLLISWLPPADPNGIVTKYNLYTRIVDGRDELNHAKLNLASQHTSYESKGLQQHVEYQYWVTASTRIGEGQSSRVVSQVPTNRVPARVWSFGGIVVRPWRSAAALGCAAVGQPPPRRRWLHGEQPLHAQVSEAGELLLSGLQRADSGNYTCQVENAHGSDHISYDLVVQGKCPPLLRFGWDNINFWTNKARLWAKLFTEALCGVAVPPSSPVLYVTSATSSSILLHWKAGETGAAPISGFLLNYKRAQGDLEEINLPRRATSYELKVSQTLTLRSSVISFVASPNC